MRACLAWISIVALACGPEAPFAAACADLWGFSGLGPRMCVWP